MVVSATYTNHIFYSDRSVFCFCPELVLLIRFAFAQLIFIWIFLIPQGHFGVDGERGRKGARGNTGFRGAKGQKGEAGPMVRSSKLNQWLKEGIVNCKLSSINPILWEIQTTFSISPSWLWLRQSKTTKHPRVSYSVSIKPYLSKTSESLLWMLFCRISVPKQWDSFYWECL